MADDDILQSEKVRFQRCSKAESSKSKPKKLKDALLQPSTFDLYVQLHVVHTCICTPPCYRIQNKPSQWVATRNIQYALKKYILLVHTSTLVNTSICEKI